MTKLKQIALAGTLLILLGMPAIVSGKAAQDSSSAPMFRGNPARTGEMPGPGPNPNQDIVALWSFQTSPLLYSSPVVADGMVYVGTTDGDASSQTLYAIDASTGQQRWAIQLMAPITSTPAVVDGVIYLGNAVDAEDGVLYAIDASTGNQRWAFQRSGEFFFSSPAVVDGLVYIGSAIESSSDESASDGPEGALYAIDASTGQQRWAYQTEGINAYSSPAVADGVVYVGSGGDSSEGPDGALYAINAKTGQQLWTYQTDGAIGTSTPAVSGGVVYVGSEDDDILYAIDAASGQQRWTVQLESGELSAPAVTGGVVYISNDSSDQGSAHAGALYAVDADSGQQRWVFQTGEFLYSSPAVVDGMVYVGSGNESPEGNFDGTIYAVDAASGQQRWAYQLEEAVGFSTLAVVGRVVYVTNVDMTADGIKYGSLHAIGNPTNEMQSATTEAQQAMTIQQSWETYFQDIGVSLASTTDLPGMSFRGPATDHDRPDTQIPSGVTQLGKYWGDIAGQGAGGSVWLAMFPSDQEATAGLQQMSDGFVRSGWQIADVDGLDHDHACLSLASAGSAEAVCYMTRGDAMFISDFTVNAPAPDAALQNAVDSINAMSDAYDQVDRPE